MLFRLLALSCVAIAHDPHDETGLLQTSKKRTSAAKVSVEKVAVEEGNTQKLLMSMLSSPTVCDTNAAQQITLLENQKDSRFLSWERQVHNLAFQQTLIAVANNQISSILLLLKDQKDDLQKKEGALSDLESEIATTQSSLKSHAADLEAAKKTFSEAESALSTTETEVQVAAAARRVALIAMGVKRAEQREQTKTIVSVESAVASAEAAFNKKDTDAKAQCKQVQDCRSEAVKASQAHEQVESKLKEATTAYDNAVAEHTKRKQEADITEKALEDATIASDKAYGKKRVECKESKNAALAEDTAEGKFQAKQKVCDAMETEKERLRLLRRAARRALNIGQRAVEMTYQEMAVAMKNFATTQEDVKLTQSALADNLLTQSSAVAEHNLQCAQANTASQQVTKTTQELHQAVLDKGTANEEAQQAEKDVGLAALAKNSACEKAYIVLSKKTQAKGAADSAKLLHDHAVDDRQKQEVSLKVAQDKFQQTTLAKEAAQASLKSAEGLATAALKAKRDAFSQKAKLLVSLKASETKHYTSITDQGTKKEVLDNAIAIADEANAKFEAATKDHSLAKDNLNQAEQTTEICKGKLKANEEPLRAEELMKKMYTSMATLEVQRTVFVTTKAKLAETKKEAEAKMKNQEEAEKAYEDAETSTAANQKAVVKAAQAHDEAEKQAEARQNDYDIADSTVVQAEMKLADQVYALQLAEDQVSINEQYLSERISVENAKKKILDDAVAYFNRLSNRHEKAKNSCSTSADLLTKAEEERDEADEAFADAQSSVSALEAHLVINEETHAKERAECISANAYRVQRDEAVSASEKAKNKAAVALQAAETTADSAAKAQTEALNEKDTLLKTLRAARKVVRAQVASVATCEDEEAKLYNAWTLADAKAATEMKQCTNAKAEFAKASAELETKATPDNEAALDAEQDASEKVASLEEVHLKAVADEAAAKLSAETLDSYATSQETQCSDETEVAAKLKNELDRASDNLKTQEALLVKYGNEAAELGKEVAKVVEVLKSAVQKKAAASAAKDAAQEEVDKAQICVETDSQKVESLMAELPRAKSFVESANEIVTHEESLLLEAQESLAQRQSAIQDLEKAVRKAREALDAVIEELKAKQALLETCIPSRCEPPQGYIANWDQKVPNLLSGYSWTPTCKDGFKLDLCNGCDSTALQCNNGELSPPTFRCEPIRTGSLEVNVLEGRGLWFTGAEQFDDQVTFEFHKRPSDPFVRIEACPGPTSLTQDTEVRHDAYDPVWQQRMFFTITQKEPCNSFRIAVRDNQDDEIANQKAQDEFELEAFNFIGGTEKLAIKDGRPLAEFMHKPFETVKRRVLLENDGYVDLEYTWNPSPSE